MSDSFVPKQGFDVEGMIEGQWGVVCHFPDRREALEEAAELDRRMLYERIRVIEYDYDRGRGLQVVRTLYEASRIEREQKKYAAVEEKVQRMLAPHREQRRKAALIRARRRGQLSEVRFAVVTAAKLGTIVALGATIIFMLRGH